VSVYDMVVKTKFGPLKMNVVLPAKFPEEKPQLVILTRVQHRWVDQNMHVTSSPRMNSWNTHSNLGLAVQEAYTEFAANPPSPIATPPPQPHQPHQPHQQAQSQPPQPGPPAVQEEPEESHIPLPEIPSHFPELDKLSLEELEALNTSEEGLQDIIDRQTSTQSMNALRSELCQGIQDLAGKALAKEKDIQDWEMKTQILLVDFQEQLATLENLEARKQAITQRYSCQNLAAALDKGIAEADEAAEVMLESYFESEEKADKFQKDFYSKYVEARTLIHTRMAKKERLKDLYDS